MCETACVYYAENRGVFSRQRGEQLQMYPLYCSALPQEEGEFPYRLSQPQRVPAGVRWGAAAPGPERRD